ncbi:MAG: hypothetical protein ABJA67_13150 [Chthonomonadales bacterium]
MASIQARIIFLLVTVTALFVVAIVFWRQMDSSRINQLVVSKAGLFGCRLNWAEAALPTDITYFNVEV